MRGLGVNAVIEVAAQMRRRRPGSNVLAIWLASAPDSSHRRKRQPHRRPPAGLKRLPGTKSGLQRLRSVVAER